MKVWEAIVNNKVAVAIIALVILILVIWALFRFRKGNKKNDPITTTIRTNNQALLDGDPAAIEDLNNRAKNLAARLYAEMKGLNFFWRDFTPYKDLLAADEALFQATYNEFNVLYGDGETLRQWLVDESAVGVNEFDVLRSAIFTKMTQYGLQ